MWLCAFTIAFCCCCCCCCCTRWAFCLLCFLSLFQTCSQKSSTLFRVGWFTSDRKSLYHSFWVGPSWGTELSWEGGLAASSSRFSRSCRRSVSMISKVTFRRVCMKPCSTARHRYIPESFLLSVRISKPWFVRMKCSSDLIWNEILEAVRRKTQVIMKHSYSL